MGDSRTLTLPSRSCSTSTCQQQAGTYPRTRESNLGYIRRTIKPALGAMQIRKVRGPLLDTFCARLMRCGNLACTGKPFTEYRGVPDLKPDPDDHRPEWQQAADQLRGSNPVRATGARRRPALGSRPRPAPGPETRNHPARAHSARRRRPGGDPPRPDYDGRRQAQRSAPGPGAGHSRAGQPAAQTVCPGMPAGGGVCRPASQTGVPGRR